MPALLERPQTLEPSPANRKGAGIIAHLLEGAPMEPEAEPLRKVLLTMLREVEKKGQSFAIMALDEELTTSQAAELMGVSRAYFMRAIQSGAIAYRMVGTHHRVRLKEVLRLYEEDQRREKILDELATQAQELDMGY
jgi:excisionase family DNA binding protein